MPFNLYFAGTQNKQSEQRIEDLGCLRLLSYLNDKRHIQNRVEKGLVTFVDSGAFSAHTKGAQVDVEDYIRYVNERDEYISIFAQLDHIPGVFRQPKTREQLLEAPEKSWENYLYMVERVKSWEKVLPIYHQGEDFKHLVRLLEHTPKIPYIGISPANDVTTDEKAIWIEQVFKIIKASSHPNVKTHAFGMTSLRVLELFPFYSADSTTWIMTAANGAIITKHGVLMLSDRRLSDKTNVAHLPGPVRKEFESYLDARGYTLEELASNYKRRMTWNIEFLMDWAANYQLKPKTVTQNRLF